MAEGLVNRKAKAGSAVAAAKENSSSAAPSITIKHTAVFMFGLLCLLPYLYYIFSLDLDDAIRRSIYINAAMSFAGLLATVHVIPVASKYVLKRKMFGYDINKKGSAAGLVQVPESMGLVCGVVYLVVMFLFQHFYFTPDSEWLVEYNAALASICFMILLGFMDDVLDIPWRIKLLVPSFAALPLLMAYAGGTTVLVPKPLQGFIGFDILNLGWVYKLYMGFLAVFCTNAINIHAGINGLEVGQTVVICCGSNPNFSAAPMASGEGQLNPSTSGDAGGDHNEDYGNEYGKPLPTQEELREMEHRRRYVQKFAETTTPLHMLTQKGVPFSWGATEVTAFQTLKDKLTTEPVLILPDLQKSFEVCCDACGHSLGAVLMQEGRVIAYESRLFSKPEMTAQIYEKELMAVIHALTQWRHYLLRADFTVFIDHQSLRYFLSQKQLLKKQMRWANILSQFHFQIVHVQGQKNVVADALSRKPLVQAIPAIHHSSFEDMVDQYATDTDFVDIFTQIRDGETVAGYSIREGYLMRKTMFLTKVYSFHPQTDGQSEEANSTVLDLLKCYVSEHKATWEHYLPLVEYAYNNTVHTSTGKAPFEIVEGGKKVPPILQTKDKIFEADKYVQNTDEAYRKIKLALEKTQSKQKKAVDRHRRELVFSLGD
ncbi:hypothetical protein L7F22_011935 [Adiantum nelumboides]|nr:hypothetical protein [Adiantum nelumboides]